MKKVIALLICVLAFAIAFAAVAEDLSVAVIYSDTVDDKGWCQAMDSGIKHAMELGYDIAYTPVESVAIPDAPNVLEQLVDDYDVIIVHGAQFSSACIEAAEEYPDQCFALGTSDKILGDNVFTYMPQSEEAGYINGIAAGKLTHTNKVGIVGATKGGDAVRYVAGFILGLQQSNPDCEYMLSWTNSFSDVAAAGDTAKTMIGAGCDVLVGPAQQAVGAIRVADSSEGVLWLGQTLTQLSDFPNVVVSAADYDYSSVIVQIIEERNAGVSGGKCLPLNYANAGFVYDYSANTDLLPDDIRAAAEETVAWLSTSTDETKVDYLSVIATFD